MKCPVCKNNTFKDNDYEYDICKECFWEYDVYQVENPDESGGANYCSLNRYRKIYAELKRGNPDFNCNNFEDQQMILRLSKQKINKLQGRC